MPSVRTILFWILGFFILFLIFQTIPFARTLEIVKSARTEYILLAVAFIGLNVLTHGHKWKKILETYGWNMSTWKSTRIFCAGTMIGFLTPFKIGIFIRAWYLKGFSKIKALASILVDRITDITLVGTIAVLGIIGLNTGNVLGLHVNSFWIIGIVLAITVALIGLHVLLKNPKFLQWISKQYVNKINHIPWIEKSTQGLQEIRTFAINTPKLIEAMALGVIALMAITGAYWAILTALHIQVNFVFLLTLVPVILLIEVVPITFLGLGTRETGMILLFATQGLPGETAIAFSLVMAFLNYASLSLIGITQWIEQPVTD